MQDKAQWLATQGTMKDGTVVQALVPVKDGQGLTNVGIARRLKEQRRLHEGLR